MTSAACEFKLADAPQHRETQSMLMSTPWNNRWFDRTGVYDTDEPFGGDTDEPTYDLPFHVFVDLSGTTPIP